MKAKLKELMKEMMRAKDQVRLDAVRQLLSAIQYEEMQKDTDNLPDASMLEVLKRELKKRREELDYAEKGDRPDLLDKLNTEIQLIESFLPAQMDEAALEKLINELKAENPEINMGQAMKHLKEGYAGQYDGKLASDIARKILA